MWKQKTPAEQAVTQRKKRMARFYPWAPLAFAIVATPISVAAVWLGRRGPLDWGEPISAFDVVHLLPVRFLVFFVSGYVLQIAGVKLWFSKATAICRVCHKVTDHARETVCTCGGGFEPFENWKWVPEDKP